MLIFEIMLIIIIIPNILIILFNFTKPAWAPDKANCANYINFFLIMVINPCGSMHDFVCPNAMKKEIIKLFTYR